MSLSLEDKKAVVEQVSNALVGSQTAIVAEYRGLTVEQMTILRREAARSGVFFQVVKNTLARAGGSRDPTSNASRSIFWAPWRWPRRVDPVAAAKVLAKFDKQTMRSRSRSVPMAGGSCCRRRDQRAGETAGPRGASVDAGRDHAAPITKFVQDAQRDPSKFVRTLAAVCDAKEAV